MNLAEKIEITRIIIQHVIDFYPRVFVSCSFGKDSIVVVDLVMQIKREVQFIGIDTGYEFSETLSFAEELIKDTGMIFFWAKPSEEDVIKIDQEYGDSFTKNDKFKCCAMKRPVIERLLPQYDAWITGLRREETEYRKDIKIIEEGRIARINPIAFWTEEDVWQYIRENKLCYHPLYNKGYASLGCKPCTTQGELQSGGGRQGKFECVGRIDVQNV